MSREVDVANQLVRVVSTASTGHHPNPETVAYAHDARGIRTFETTTEGVGSKATVVGLVSYAFDGRDDLVSVVDAGANLKSSRDDEVTRFERDGAGRALTVVEDGSTTARLYDGLDVVAEGTTQLVLGPLGSVQSEVTTSWSGSGPSGTWVTDTQDVLTDALGSPVGVATEGVVSTEVRVFDDFGDVVEEASWDTVTGFTGRPVTSGLVEFATRTFDPEFRVWLQADTYRGTTSRASSLNRYAYVEGAPETFVDHLGFFRAAAAIQAQKLAALQAAFASAAKARAQVAPNCSGFGCYSLWLAKKTLNAQYAQMYGPPAPGRQSARELFEHGLWVAAETKRVRDAADANVAAYNKSQDKGYLGGLVDLISDSAPEIRRNLTWLGNHIRPDNLVATYGTLALAEIGGADCTLDSDHLIYVCGAAPDWMYGRGALKSPRRT